MTTQKQILVVDDDADIRDTMRIVLESNGYKVVTACNGKEAMKILEAFTPDLMILDVMMSHDTEGFDLAFALKKDPAYEGMPIILLTAFMDKVREEGPDEYQHVMGQQWPAKWLFEKPVNHKRLLKKIEGILN